MDDHQLMPYEFLYCLERNWLKDFPTAHASIFYNRYVDDIFVLLKSDNRNNSLLTYVNYDKHSDIKFTCEIEQAYSLAFLHIN